MIPCVLGKPSPIPQECRESAQTYVKMSRAELNILDGVGTSGEVSRIYKVLVPFYLCYYDNTAMFILK